MDAATLVCPIGIEPTMSRHTFSLAPIWAIGLRFAFLLREAVGFRHAPGWRVLLPTYFVTVETAWPSDDCLTPAFRLPPCLSSQGEFGA